MHSSLREPLSKGPGLNSVQEREKESAERARCVATLVFSLTLLPSFQKIRHIRYRKRWVFSTGFLQKSLHLDGRKVCESVGEKKREKNAEQRQASRGTRRRHVSARATRPGLNSGRDILFPEKEEAKKTFFKDEKNHETNLKKTIQRI